VAQARAKRGRARPPAKGKGGAGPPCPGLPRGRLVLGAISQRRFPPQGPACASGPPGTTLAESSQGPTGMPQSETSQAPLSNNAARALGPPLSRGGSLSPRSGHDKAHENDTLPGQRGRGTGGLADKGTGNRWDPDRITNPILD
jgi:hypothetical protein